MRKLLIAIIFALFALTAKAQNNDYQTASQYRYSLTNPDYMNTGRPLTYSEMKFKYNPDAYNPAIMGGPYNPFIAGVASFLIPGLGQLYCDELGRGFSYFLKCCGSIILLPTLGVTAALVAPLAAPVLIFVGTLGGMALYVAYYVGSIIDAYNMAKIKDIYFYDLRHSLVKLNFSLEPTLNIAQNIISNKLVPGLSLKLSF